MEERKVAIIFTNDNGEYYLETVEVFKDFETLKDNWNSVVINDETDPMGDFRFTQVELNNPTTAHAEQFAVIEYLEED